MHERNAVSPAELEKRIAKHEIAVLETADWTAMADAFDEVERHDTVMAGPLVIIRTAHGLAAVEQPTPSERVVRLVGSAAAAQQFVTGRMAQYERMWDGCGCRIRYYE